MDALPAILGPIKELAVPLFVFVALLAYSVVRGQRPLLSLILGLYLALLISLKFPYYDLVFAKMEMLGDTTKTLIIFAFFTAFGSILFERLLTRLIEEGRKEGIAKKVVLAILGTILIMAYSYHVLPITTLIDPGTQIAQLFAPEEYFFWWLMLPLIGLFFVI